MRKWGNEEFGQSVCQVTVRNKTTKDNPGTLPINGYIAKSSDPKPVDFSYISLTTPSKEKYPRPANALFQKRSFLQATSQQAYQKRLFILADVTML